MVVIGWKELMRYSLLNRFRGALLGSFIGEILGSSNGGSERSFSKAMLTPPNLGDTQPTQTILDWSQIADCGTESLISCGKLDLEDWVCRVNINQPSLALLKTTASNSEAAVAMLPVALFFHDDEVKLQQQLIQSVALWQKESETSEGVLAVAYAIALALTERLDHARLIPRILAYLEKSQTPLVQQLEQVQTLLEQGAGLDTTVAQLCRERSRSGELSSLSSTLIALAFYCFLSTPEDFRLSVTRAARTGYQPQTTATLTGILSGVYNSILGIPVGWHLAANRISGGVQRMQQADRLLAVWSGVYDVSAAKPRPLAAIAAPRVIQPR